MPNNETKRAFTIDEFSDRWGWARSTTYKLIRAGELPTIKIGRCRRITAEQEEEFRKYKEDQQL